MSHPNIKCGTGKALRRENEITHAVAVAMEELGPSRRRHPESVEGDGGTMVLRHIELASALAARAEDARRG